MKKLLLIFFGLTLLNHCKNEKLNNLDQPRENSSHSSELSWSSFLEKMKDDQ